MLGDYREKYPTAEKKSRTYHPYPRLAKRQKLGHCHRSIGFDGGKLIKGRKWFVLIDTTGATLATRVLPTNAHDGQSALAWWAKLAHHPLLGKVKWVFIDGGFRGQFVEQMAKQYQLDVLVPQEVVRQAGKFRVHATHWMIERSIAWITNNRRLARCYERKIVNEKSFILLCNIRQIVKKY